VLLLTPIVTLNEVKDPSQPQGRKGFLPNNSANGKAIYGVEYKGKPAKFCPIANEMGFSWLKMTHNLDGSKRINCLAEYP
jgi:hypothetical protein